MVGQVVELPISEGYRAEVQIIIFKGESNYRAYIDRDKSNPIEFKIGLKPNDVADLNGELHKAIQEVADSFDPENPLSSDDALKDLADWGSYAFEEIFPRGKPRDTVNRALSQKASVHIISDDLFLPWELLYDSSGIVGSSVDPTHFWGMKHIISRVAIPVDDHDRPGDFAGCLIETELPQIGLIADTDLEYVVNQEIPALNDFSERGQLFLVQLRALKDEKREEDLASFGHFLRDEAHHIIHFACHAYERKPLMRSCLSISDGFEITIREFVTKGFEVTYNPFVILNACLTGVTSPLHTSNWVEKFWNQGARGVLATEFRVPDDFAAAFIKHLYTYFMQGFSIGQCIFATRDHFLREEHNPLGLAYALYSSPLIRIVKT